MCSLTCGELALYGIYKGVISFTKIIVDLFLVIMLIHIIYSRKKGMRKC